MYQSQYPDFILFFSSYFSQENFHKTTPDASNVLREFSGFLDIRVCKFSIKVSSTKNRNDLLTHYYIKLHIMSFKSLKK